MALTRHCHTTTSGTGFPLTINKPTSGSAGPSPKNVAVGDLIVILVSNDGTEDTALWDNGTNKPSGFTFINESGNGTSDTHCAAFYRIADGTEGATFSIPAAVSHDGAAICILYSGQHATTPINIVSADSLVGSATSLGVTGANTTVNNCLACAVVSFDGGDEGGYSTSGTGWAEVLEARSGSTSADESMCWSEKTVASAGATGTCTFTIGGSADGLAGFQFAIAPSSGATGTLTQTLGALTLAAAALVGVGGSSTPTLGALTAAGSATVGPPVATLAQNLGSLSVSGDGDVVAAAALTQTLGALTLSGTGSITTGPVGGLARNLDNVSLSGEADVLPRGTLGQSLGALTLASQATLSLEGALAQSLAPLTLSGAGPVALVGSSAPTLGAVTLSGAAHVAAAGVTGNLDVTLGGGVQAGPVVYRGRFARFFYDL